MRLPTFALQIPGKRVSDDLHLVVPWRPLLTLLFEEEDYVVKVIDAKSRSMMETIKATEISGAFPDFDVVNKFIAIGLRA